MPPRPRRFAAALMLAAGGGLLLSSPNTGCLSFAAESTASALDFCFIFDCQSGALGGTIKWCDGGFSLFADCPEQP